MREYEVYIIAEPFVLYYYRRENMFFNLFKEYKESGPDMKEILAKQVEYVTKPIPKLSVRSLLSTELHGRSDFFIKDGLFTLENNKGKAELEIKKNLIKICSSGNFETEMAFMEALGKSRMNFLAIDYKNERYGWIKPLRILKSV